MYIYKVHQQGSQIMQTGSVHGVQNLNDAASYVSVTAVLRIIHRPKIISSPFPLIVSREWDGTLCNINCIPTERV